jgi:dTDP-4-dehydrorhamnose 3,5-epimerase
MSSLLFHPVEVRGAYLIEPVKHADSRGFFARTWCRREFEAQGLNAELVQASLSCNTSAGTLRGLHYQSPPHAEAKLVRCSRGAIFDVLVDLRPGSPTFGRWLSAELSSTNGQMFYIPEGIAHGFLTLVDDTEVVYFMSAYFAPEAARGVRFDDPALGIRWPLTVSVISPRDTEWPSFPGGATP